MLAGWGAQRLRVHEGTYQNPEAVEKLGGMGVDAARVLELAKLEQLVDHFHVDTVALLEVGQVLLLVAPQVCDDVLVIQQAADLARGVLELVALLQHFLALLLVLVRHVGEAVDLLVQLANKVGHVGGLEQLEQQLLLLGRLLGLFIAREVEERVDEVAVEMGHELGEQRVLFGDVCAGCRRVGHGGRLSGGWVCGWLGGRARNSRCRRAAVVLVGEVDEKRLCASEDPCTLL